MSIICPCVTAPNTHVYRTQLEKITPFAKRIHVDVGDGEFAPKLIDIDQLWFPENIPVDLHVMYKNPTDYVDNIIKLSPSLVIVHAEANGKYYEIAEKLKAAGIKTGVALLEKTQPDVIAPSINFIDYVMIFSGHLGYYGGIANLELLNKISKIKSTKADIEIGWDGGINETNAKQLSKSGIDVMNVGGYIQQAKDPKEAYAKLELALRGGE